MGQAEDVIDEAEKPQHDRTGLELMDSPREDLEQGVKDEPGRAASQPGKPAVRKENLLYSPFFQADEPPSR